MTIQWSIFE